MLPTKPLLLFLLKAAIIYALLSTPISLYDEMYGTYYRACANKLFHRFHGNGVAWFSEGNGKFATLINVANKLSVGSDNQTDILVAAVDTRWGYHPTILIITLILSSPVPLKRKTIAMASGIILVTGMVMIKQWIDIMYLCEKNKWLKLYDFSESNKKVLEKIYIEYVDSVSPALLFVVAIWILVTFRKDDLKILQQGKA